VRTGDRFGGSVDEFAGGLLGEGARPIENSLMLVRGAVVLYIKVAIIRSDFAPGAGWQLVCDRVWLRPLSIILGGESELEMPL